MRANGQANFLNEYSQRISPKRVLAFSAQVCWWACYTQTSFVTIKAQHATCPFSGRAECRVFFFFVSTHSTASLFSRLWSNFYHFQLHIPSDPVRVPVPISDAVATLADASIILCPRNHQWRRTYFLVAAAISQSPRTALGPSCAALAWCHRFVPILTCTLGHFCTLLLVSCSLHVLGALRLRRLTSCRVVCGPVRGPIYVEACEDCVIVAAGRQVRCIFLPS